VVTEALPYQKRGRDIPGFLTLNPGLPGIAVETEMRQHCGSVFHRHDSSKFAGL